jgi:hypothetical protein
MTAACTEFLLRLPITVTQFGIMEMADAFIRIGVSHSAQSFCLNWRQLRPIARNWRSKLKIRIGTYFSDKFKSFLDDLAETVFSRIDALTTTPTSIGPNFEDTQHPLIIRGQHASDCTAAGARIARADAYLARQVPARIW